MGWRKSSFSSGATACVEVAAGPLGVAVRDSKDRGGPVIAVPAAGWRGVTGEGHHH
jgi:hypothetical protein